MSVILKPGKEGVIKRGHPWIFSGAIAKWPTFENGSVLSVTSASGDFIGLAYFNRKCSIAGRMLSYADLPLKEILRGKIESAYALRRALIPSDTTAFRLINAEGDGLPGLIVDLYEKVLVLQISTLGMAKMRPLLIELFSELLPIEAIYEKSTSASLALEGLKPKEEWVKGASSSEVAIFENGLKFIVDIVSGQKTGFFLDQREMRQFVGSIAKGKKVLNTFAYSGGFSLYALRGGASEVTSVDISPLACALTERHVALNGLTQHKTLEADVFDYLRQDQETFDVIILDPPAFAKRKQDEKKAFRGYKEINIQALKKLNEGGILITCSCSYFFDKALFQTMLAEAARDAGCSLRLLSEHRNAPDHPVALVHPEGSYLKSLTVAKLPR